jgi:Uncharacterized protein conserved in bacteria
MMYVRGCSGRAVLFAATSLFLAVLSSQAEVQSGQVLIQAVTGEAMYLKGDSWKPLQAQQTVTKGTAIKTGPNSSVDLILQYNGTVLRLTQNSTLSFDKLNKEEAGDDVVTETSLNLLAGSLVGSQRKLASPSTFQINIPGGTATIKGTEYLVRSDGAVTCVSGSVSVNYNLPGNGGSVKVTIPAGFSFDPSSGKVVPTSASYLQHIIADINTVRQNAQVFKTGGATVVVKAEGVISPTKGNNGVGNGQDPPPPGNPPVNDGPGTGPGNPGRGRAHRTVSQQRTP